MFHLFYLNLKGLTSLNKICFSCFSYTVTITFNEFKRNKLHISGGIRVVRKKMFWDCNRFRDVSLFKQTNISKPTAWDET